MGLHRAWPDAEITGVDIAPQPRYPFRFVQGDAMTHLLDGFDFAWASPPCQAYSALRTRHPDKRYPDLLAATRARLLAWGGPWIVENVPGAPFDSGVTLCGTMFGLRVYRHRSFESSALLLAPPHRPHRERINAESRGRTLAYYTREAGRMVTVAGHLFGLAAGSAAMGIDWMSRAELAQAVPPAYSEHLARQYGPLGAMQSSEGVA